MATAYEAYKRFLLKINKNDTNSNINISKAEFVLLYKEQKRVWLNDKLTQDSDNIKINHLAELLIKDKELVKSSNDNNSTSFILPENYFLFDSSYSLANKGQCQRPIINWLVKSKNINVLLQDSNSSPSFEYEETICILSEKKLVIYKTDFEIQKAYLSYYREPIDIDLEGYEKLDGTPSTTINPDIEDQNLEEILNRCAMEVVRNYENQEAAQMAKDRIASEN